MTRLLVGRQALDPPPGGSAVTIGTFDGVHLGHRTLIARTSERAGALGATSVALTWDRHPAATLRPDRVPPLLTAPERKIELLEETGIDVVAVIPFDRDFSRLSPRGFVEEVLVGGLGCKAVLVGDDWRFGHKAAGDVPLLTELGRELGFEVAGVPLQEVAGEAVSSSRARRAVASGDLALARLLLGRPFDLGGPVRRGAGRGKTLGFPTANVALDAGVAHPPRGVYAGRVRVRGLDKPAAINIGVNPTFGGDPETTPLQVEAFILDFEGELYEQRLLVELWQRLRDEERFETVDDLVAQIRKDVAATRALVEG